MSCDKSASRPPLSRCIVEVQVRLSELNIRRSGADLEGEEPCAHSIMPDCYLCMCMHAGRGLCLQLASNDTVQKPQVPRYAKRLQFLPFCLQI